MPDLSKKKMRAVIDMNMVSLARVHKFYLMGFGWSIEPEEEVRKANEFIRNIEQILLSTGYMTQAEINARHQTFLPKPGSVIVGPADSLL